MAFPTLHERMRQAYLALPFSASTKQRLVTLVYRTAGPLFRGTVHYETWKQVHAVAVPKPRPDSLLPAELMLEQTRFEQTREPTVSIVVCAQHGYRTALRCLHAIATHAPAASFEVILVDDAGTDQDVRSLARIPGLRMETLAASIGYVGCCNRGSELARGQFLHFLSDRILVRDGWLDGLLSAFAVHPDCMLAGPKVLLPDGRLDAAGGVVWRDGSAWHFGHGDDPSRSQYGYLRETDYCSAAALMVRKAAFEALGRFNESGKAGGCEDVDLAFRARASRGRVVYQPSAVVSQSEVSVGAWRDGPQQLAHAHAIRAAWAGVLDSEHRSYDSGVRIARERLRPRRTVLIVDHYVPKPDRDAGSRSVWDIITTLLGDGWNVKFWPHTLWYEPGYTERLQSLGVEVFHGAENSERFGTLLEELGQTLAAVLINRPRIAKEYLPLVRLHSNAKVLYYGHEIVFLRLREQALVQNARPNGEQRYMSRLEPRIWKLSDTVLYASDLETAEVRAVDSAIEARTIPLLAFDEFVSPRAPSGRAVAKLLFVGGFGHPPNRDGALWLLRDVLPILRSRGTAFELQVVGANAPDELRPHLA
ncbi:MAG: glycosyltransferase, partial [Burkholderiaceae bacterium]|nr:glycosyltransferase [Burkholderiaceae bacterium]